MVNIQIKYIKDRNKIEIYNSETSITDEINLTETPYFLRANFRSCGDCPICLPCDKCEGRINFDWIENGICIPLEVQFRDRSDTSLNNPIAWEWTFYDSTGKIILNRSTSQNPKYTYNKNGIYKIILKVIYTDCYEELEKTIIINKPTCGDEPITNLDLLCCINTLNTAYTIDYITYEKDSGVKSVPVTDSTNKLMSVNLSHASDIKYLEVGVMVTDTKQFTLNTVANCKQSNDIDDKNIGTSSIFKIRYEQPGNVIKRTLLNGSIDTLNLFEPPTVLKYEFANKNEEEVEKDLLVCIDTTRTVYTINYITYENDSGVKNVPITSPTNMAVELSYKSDMKYVEVGVMVTDMKQFALHTIVNCKDLTYINDKNIGTSSIFKIRYEQLGNVIKRTLLNGSVDTLNLIEIPTIIRYEFKEDE